MASLFGFREFQNKCKMQLSDLVMFFKKMLWWFEGCFQNIGSVKNVPPMQCRVCKRNCDTWTRERKGWRIKKDFCEQRVCGHGKTSGLCLWTLTIEIREAGTTAVYKKREVIEQTASLLCPFDSIPCFQVQVLDDILNGSTVSKMRIWMTEFTHVYLHNQKHAKK